MKLQLIKIGNSKGVRIPKEFLQGYGEDTRFDLRKVGDSLILSPTQSRSAWADQIKNEAPETVPFLSRDFDDTEWVWK